MATSGSDLPRWLGPYRLENVLGRGGMGVVYLAYHERLDRRVAVKRVLAERTSPKRRARLRREARTAAQLSHPNIVQVFDLIEGDEDDWIVMELVDGVPLNERLSDGPLNVSLALTFAQQVAEGLAAAHALGIIHRDLKTENVMVLAGERIKILDFGLAKRLGPRHEETYGLSVAGQVLGTGRAMSPEQARGAEVGPASDLFSLGVMLYEMLTGISPFRGPTVADTLSNVLTLQQTPAVDIVAEVPHSLSRLVDRLLSKAPELRPPSAQVVADDLARLIDEGRGTATRSPEILADAHPLDVTEEPTAPTTPAVLASEARATSRPKERQTDTGHRRPLSLLAAALAVLAVVFLVARPWPFHRSTKLPAAESQPLLSQANDPLARYQAGMEATRRPDQPESLNRAVQIFQQLLEEDSESAAAHAGLARAYWHKAGNSVSDPVFAEQASAVAREAVRLDPYLADAQISLGLVHLLQGHPEEAQRAFETALELDPDEADALYGMGKVAQAGGLPKEAEGHYRRAVALRPATLYHNALGALFYENGRYGEAEERFRLSLELAPDNIYSLRNLAGILHFQGRIDEAASLLQEALKIRPEASLYSNLGAIFFDRGLYTKAADVFEKALELQGANDFVFWTNLADAYRQIPGKEDAARSTYRRALQLLDRAVAAAPADVRMVSRRALTLARANRCEEARSDIADVRNLDSTSDVFSHYRLAISEELCGDRHDALGSLETALRGGLSLSAVEREPDLLDLRADPRFHHLLMKLEEAQ
ncbi:MAG: protein kinase [Acidobacteriota bacterium]